MFIKVLEYSNKITKYDIILLTNLSASVEIINMNEHNAYLSLRKIILCWIRNYNEKDNPICLFFNINT